MMVQMWKMWTRVSSKRIFWRSFWSKEIGQRKKEFHMCVGRSSWVEIDISKLQKKLKCLKPVPVITPRKLFSGFENESKPIYNSYTALFNVAATVIRSMITLVAIAGGLMKWKRATFSTTTVNVISFSSYIFEAINSITRRLLGIQIIP